MNMCVGVYLCAVNTAGLLVVEKLRVKENPNVMNQDQNVSWLARSVFYMYIVTVVMHTSRGDLTCTHVHVQGHTCIISDCPFVHTLMKCILIIINVGGGGGGVRCV